MLSRIIKAIIRRRKVSAFVASMSCDRTLKTGVTISYPFSRWAYSYVSEYREAKLSGFIPKWPVALRSKILLNILRVQWRIFWLTGAGDDD